MGPDPPKSPPSKRLKDEGSPPVIWLKLEDRHYQRLKPVGKDWRLEEAVPEHAVRVEAGDFGPQLSGAGRTVTASSRALPKSSASVRTQAVSDSSCARLLGLHKVAPSTKGPASVATSGCRKLLGLQAAGSQDRQSTAGEALGLHKPNKLQLTHVEHAPHDNYQAGELYVCRCGWKPPSGLTNAQRGYSARRHWRHCVGAPPPRAASQNVRQRVARKGWCNPVVKRLQAQARYLAWYKKLKGKWLDATCEGDPEAPETHSFRAVVTHVYRCRRCSKVSSLSELRRFPCSKRNKSKGVTVANWISKWQGVEKALAHQDQTRSATRKFYSQKRRAGSKQPEAKGSKKRKAAGS